MLLGNSSSVFLQMLKFSLPVCHPVPLCGHQGASDVGLALSMSLGVFWCVGAGQERVERCGGLRAGSSSPGSRGHGGCCRAKSCSWLGCGLKDAAFLQLVLKVFWKTALLLLPGASSM